MTDRGSYMFTAADWLLTVSERKNSHTRIDSRHASCGAWTAGNDVRAHVHGANYFPELLRCIRAMGAGDLLLFTDWRGDPDQLLDGPGTEVSRVLCDAARRGVIVKGLVWRSHLDLLAFSEEQNRHLGEDINAAGGEVLRDMRVRPDGSHHQKFVVLRHPGRPEMDVAFVGGIDLCHSRGDDHGHAGDAQRQPMAKVYGERPPWHDAQLAVRGPAVGDVETVFRERWEDPAPLNRNPIDRLSDRIHGDDRVTAGPLPKQLADPAPCGRYTVQLLRTYPKRRQGYPFAPEGERSIALGYQKAASQARNLIYLEDQYLWSPAVVGCFAKALRANPELHLIAVIPSYPDQDGRISMPPNLIGREQAINLLKEAGGDRVAVYGLENAGGYPVYVHAKICVIDDTWCAVGSGNLNRRSWTHDSELSCAVVDDDSAGVPAAPDEQDPAAAESFALQLRLQLAGEHLDRAASDTADLRAARGAFAAFAASARNLDHWHASGQEGPRPSGQLRAYATPHLAGRTKAWATLLYRLVYDPDGRPLSARLRRQF
jgi:phosphatidylserine/phosphatidylglycerophosphate/cardiolipin synthase-like enzyme